MTASGSAFGSEDYSVLTPERVSLRYDVATLGSRGAAALLDTAIQGVVGVAVVILAAFLSGAGFGFGPDDSGWVAVVRLILIALGGFFLLWGYYVTFEVLWSGQTPGKRALGLRVIRENGYPLRPADAIARNLIRIVDGPPVGAVLGALVMLCNSRAKRLGDFAAGTIVVREGDRRRLGQLNPIAQQTPPENRPAGAPASITESASTTAAGPEDAAVMPALSAEDATLVRDFLVRRAELFPEARGALAARLAQHLARRYGYPLPVRDAADAAERLLETVAG